MQLFLYATYYVLHKVYVKMEEKMANRAQYYRELNLSSYMFDIGNKYNDFATYLNPEGTVYMMGQVVDSEGNYITLYTEQIQSNGKYGARTFLVKISADGKKIIESSKYESVSNIDIPMAITIDECDNVYVTGMSLSIPTISGMPDIVVMLLFIIIILILMGKLDNEDIPIDILKAFILKFDSRNMEKEIDPVNSVYFGGSGVNIGFDIADDGLGNVWVTGMTSSKNFPIKDVKAAYQNKNRGSFDVFICKVDNETFEIKYSTYLGGSIKDIAQSIFTDEDGYVYVTGIADNVEKEDDIDKVGNFNTTASAFQKNFGGGLSDGFIIKLRNDGQVVYCSYIGDKDNDSGTAVTADGNGNAYVTGNTGKSFPIKGNPYQKGLGLKTEGIFIAKINDNGTELINSTFFGGNYTDSSKKIIFIDEEICIYGNTSSKDFPMMDESYRPMYFGEQDVFFSKLSYDLSTLNFSSYMGGSKRESASAIVIIDEGNYLLLGDTLSRDFPTTEGAAHQGYKNTKGEGFLGLFTQKSFNNEVNIPDLNLKNAIYKILKKNIDDKITGYELMRLPRYIDLSNKGISNLEGIQYAIYLLGINLSNNQLESIALLTSISYLNYLDLRANKINDITPLKDLKDICYLYISNNKIENISVLQNLKLMIELKADNNKISTMTNMERVRTITLDNNSIGDLSVLSNSKFLVKVSATSENISKVINKNLSEDVVLSLEFLKKVDSSLPEITDISNNGVLDTENKKITWNGITTDTIVSFKFNDSSTKGWLENMDGEVLVQINNIDSIAVDLDSEDVNINGFSTFLGFETSSILNSVVSDSKGNFYVLYNKYENVEIYNAKYPEAKSIVINKISADGKNSMGILEIGDNNEAEESRKVVVGNSMAIDGDDNIYIVGNTTWSGLPTTEGVVKSTMDIKDKDVYTEGFIMKYKYNTNESRYDLICSTFLGGSGSDNCKCVAVEADGSVWVGGRTTSANFPITKETAYQSQYSGIFGKLFFTKLNNDFSKIEYSTFLGSEVKEKSLKDNDKALRPEGIDDLYDIKIDKNGNLYGVGAAEYLVAPEFRNDVNQDTNERSWNTTTDAYQKEFGGGESDAFVVKFKSNGEVVYVTYLGGNTMDIATSIDIDDKGCLYVLGFTKGDFIVTENSYSKVYDVKEFGMFITKFSEDGREIIASTYFGGSYYNFTKGIKVSGDNVYIVGATNSLDFEITESALQKDFNIGLHGFLSIFSGDLSELKYSTFIEGSVMDEVDRVLVDKDGNIILGGGTSSPDFPITEGVYKESYSNNETMAYIYGDGFLIKIKLE